jgi:hypothetical protein
VTRDQEQPGIEIGAIGIRLESGAVADAGLLAHHLQPRLRAMRLPPLSGSLEIDRIRLPGIQARPGEPPDLLAGRIVQALETELAARVAGDATGDAS